MPTFGVHADFTKVGVRNSLGRYAQRSGVVFDRSIKHAARRGAQVSRTTAPSKSGALRKSIHGSGRGGAARIWSDSPYARVVELGDKRRRIPASGRARMTFYWEKRGRMFGYGGSDSGKFDKRNWPAVVTRPKFKPQPYLRPGLEAAEQAMIDYMKKNL